MSAPTLQSTTEVWRFDPPELCERAYSKRGPILVHYLHRTVATDGSVHLSVKGVPTTSTGKPNGGIDWRAVTDTETQRLHLLVLDAKNAAHPTNP